MLLAGLPRAASFVGRVGRPLQIEQPGSGDGEPAKSPEPVTRDAGLEDVVTSAQSKLTLPACFLPAAFYFVTVAKKYTGIYISFTWPRVGLRLM